MLFSARIRGKKWVVGGVEKGKKGEFGGLSEGRERAPFNFYAEG